MPNRHRSPLSGQLLTARLLKSFNSSVHEYGTFFAGFDWQVFGCGTYSKPVSAESAERTFTTFLARLKKHVGCPVACIAVLEHRYSGNGNYAIPFHWHFLLATHSSHHRALLEGVRALWGDWLGDQKIAPYDRHRGGAHYFAKLASHQNFEFRVENLDRLSYNGPADLYRESLSSPNVPDHVRGMRFAQTLTVRQSASGMFQPETRIR